MKWHIARAVGAAPPAQVLREIVKAIIWCTRAETSVTNVGLMGDKSVGGCTKKIVKYCVKGDARPHTTCRCIPYIQLRFSSLALINECNVERLEVAGERYGGELAIRRKKRYLPQ